MSNFAVIEGKRLLAALGIDPVYVVSNGGGVVQLTDAEHGIIFGEEFDDAIAFTSVVADIAFRDYLRYDWQGRGCCIVFRQPPAWLGETKTLGSMLHEAGHYVADCDRPERDDEDHDRAVRTLNARKVRTAAEHHDQRWLRATVHLWHRACKLGYEIPIAEVVNMERYGFGRKDLLPLLDEAERREGESIESILGSTVGSQSQSSANVARRNKPRFPKVMMLACGPAKIYADGSIETCPDLHGRGGRRFASWGDYRAAMAKAS